MIALYSFSLSETNSRSTNCFCLPCQLASVRYNLIQLSTLKRIMRLLRYSYAVIVSLLPASPRPRLPVNASITLPKPSSLKGSLTVLVAVSSAAIQHHPTHLLRLIRPLTMLVTLLQMLPLLLTP